MNPTPDNNDMYRQAPFNNNQINNMGGGYQQPTY